MRRLCVAVAALFIGAAVAPSFAGPNDESRPAFPGRGQADDRAAKEALVDQLISAAERRAEKEWDSGARASIRATLLSRSLHELSEAAAQGGDHAVDVLMGVRALGSNLNEWVFVPVVACRILDTRPASGAQGAGTGPYLAGTVHSFDVAGGTSGCTIPFPTAKAAVLNFIAVGASGNGNLRAWAFDNTNPPAPPTAVLNFTTGFNTSNSQVHPICNTATATAADCSDDLFVEPFINQTHVAIDTVGYFRPATTIASVAGANGVFVSMTDGLCHNITSCSITNDTSTTRGVIVSGVAQVQMPHTTAQLQTIHVSLSNVNGTTCNTVEGSVGHAMWDIVAELPTMACCPDLSLAVSQRFSLAAGAIGTFFLNGIAVNPIASGQGPGSNGANIECVLDQ